VQDRVNKFDLVSNVSFLKAIPIIIFKQFIGDHTSVRIINRGLNDVRFFELNSIILYSFHNVKLVLVIDDQFGNNRRFMFHQKIADAQFVNVGFMNFVPHNQQGVCIGITERRGGVCPESLAQRDSWYIQSRKQIF
jgi:hypothetical protein